MGAFTSEEITKKLTDYSTLLKYMPFLQEHGFSEFGKGQLTGRMDLLKEGLSDSTTKHLDQQADSGIIYSQGDPGSFHEYEDELPKISGTRSINTSANLNSKNRRQDFNDVEKNHRIAENPNASNFLEQSKGRKYLPENNKWIFKADDESSWITRIRKLADM